MSVKTVSVEPMMSLKDAKSFARRRYESGLADGYRRAIRVAGEESDRINGSDENHDVQRGALMVWNDLCTRRRTMTNE